MKIKSNYHTHTTRCGHAYGEDEQYVLAAIEAGFDILGFAEHMAYPTLDFEGERMSNESVDGYIKMVAKYKEKYKGTIDLQLGFEFEYYDGFDEYLNHMREISDFMIIGQHFKRIDGYSYDFLSTDEDVIEYATAIEKACDKGLCDIIAHPDYFMLGRRDFSQACKEAAHIIAKAAQRNNVLIEINLNGLRYGKIQYADKLLYPYPLREMYEIFSQYDVKFIYGYDAHKPITLLEDWRIVEVNKILEGLDLEIVDRI